MNPPTPTPTPTDEATAAAIAAAVDENQRAADIQIQKERVSAEKRGAENFAKQVKLLNQFAIRSPLPELEKQKMVKNDNKKWIS